MHIGSHKPELSTVVTQGRGLQNVPLDVIWSLLFSDLDMDEAVEFKASTPGPISDAPTSRDNPGRV